MTNAPLQAEVTALIADGFHRPSDVLRALRTRYHIRPETVWHTVSKLARRGAIRRIRRGWYEAE